MPAVSMLWVGERLSNLEQLSITSYLSHGYDVHLYVYAPIENVPDGTTLCDANEILPREKIFTYEKGLGRGSVAAFANLFRYKLLWERGGIWSDTDIVCLRRFELEERPFTFVSERCPEPEGRDSSPERLLWRMRYRYFPVSTVTNCFIQAPAGSPVMEACYREAASRHPAELNWGETGPALLQQMVSRQSLDAHVLAPDVVCPADWWSIEDLIRPGFRLPKRTVAIHFWNEMWRRTGLDKDGVYPSASLYERLKTLFGLQRTRGWSITA